MRHLILKHIDLQVKDYFPGQWLPFRWPALMEVNQRSAAMEKALPDSVMLC